MDYPKRLIEVDLPIRAISEHARKDQNIRKGHLHTMHVWWATRPLASCRAVIMATLLPDPADLDLVHRKIRQYGGIDITYGGFGINGHFAFNEPPAPGATMSVEELAALGTRVVPLACETRAINSVTVGGEIGIVPRRAVTAGAKECLAARRLRLYCNRPWQSAVVRRALHGPITAACPASLARLHPDAVLTVADYVAQPPNIMLR